MWCGVNWIYLTHDKALGKIFKHCEQSLVPVLTIWRFYRRTLVHIINPLNITVSRLNNIILKEITVMRGKDKFSSRRVKVAGCCFCCIHFCSHLILRKWFHICKKLSALCSEEQEEIPLECVGWSHQICHKIAEGPSHNWSTSAIIQ